MKLKRFKEIRHTVAECRKCEAIFSVIDVCNVAVVRVACQRNHQNVAQANRSEKHSVPSFSLSQEIRFGVSRFEVPALLLFLFLGVHAMWIYLSSVFAKIIPRGSPMRTSLIQHIYIRCMLAIRFFER